jgi:hypothetical protein
MGAANEVPERRPYLVVPLSALVTLLPGAERWPPLLEKLERT